MPADHADPDRPRPGRRRLLWCEECSLVAECSAADLLRFAQAGWPACCGRPMAAFDEDPRHRPDDTAVDAPPLRPA